MRIRIPLAASLASVALLGCASAKQQVTSDEPPTSRWVGSLQPTQQRTGNVAVTGQNRTFGTVTIGAPSGGSMSRMRVNLTVAVPTASSTQLRWAILPDRCGSGDLPIIGFEQFPLIEIGNNGRGEVTVELPLEMTANSSYHVNVYLGGQQLDNVLTCGNLKYESK